MNTLKPQKNMPLEPPYTETSPYTTEYNNNNNNNSASEADSQSCSISDIYIYI